MGRQFGAVEEVVLRLKELLFLSIADVAVLSVDVDIEIVRVDAHSTTDGAPCPVCAVWSNRVHGSYLRFPADVPSAGRNVVLRILRRDRAVAAERLRLGPQAPQWTPEERATWERMNVGRPWFDAPISLLPVAQLYARDVPFLCPPDADLLQVLWCPFDHEMAHPRTALFWRSPATVTDVLDAPPEPPIVQRDCYLPEPCLFSPEQVTEFPHPRELSKELREQLDDMSRWETIDPARYNTYADDPGELYLNNLSTAPGWKTGGWSSWPRTDPKPLPLPRVQHRAGPATHHRLLGVGRRQRDLDRQGRTDQPGPASPGSPGRQLHLDRHHRRLRPPTPCLPGIPGPSAHRTAPVSQAEVLSADVYATLGTAIESSVSNLANNQMMRRGP